MKKIVIFISIFVLSIFQSAFANNIIYGADIKEMSDGKIALELKSDYDGKAHFVKETDGSVYFDIKNASLAENYKTNYKGDLSLVSQQIGSKVRIYLKGENLDNPFIIFSAAKSGTPLDLNLFLILSSLIGILYLACKFYSATMVVPESKIAVKTPMQTAKDLNRQLYGFEKKHPEIVLNKTNTIKSNVLVDFQYAKDRKNTKIAI